MAGTAIQIAWQGRKAYERRMKTARVRLRKEMKRRIREGANVIKKKARANIKSQFRGGTKKRSKQVLRTVNEPRKGLARMTTVSVRMRRGRVRAEIGTKFPEGVYGSVLEHGGTVIRREGAYKKGSLTAVTRKKHTATYRARPWLGTAVASTRRDVYRITGKSFKVV